MDASGWIWFYEGLGNARRRRPFDPETLDRLQRARALLDEGFTDPVALDDLARAACYSRFHFLRLFRAAFADTPHRYLARRRMDAAARLLSTTDLPVTEVCHEVGFHSLGSFSRTFRAATGAPPLAYRRTHRRRIYPGVALQPAIPCCFLRMFGAPRSAIPEK